MQASQYLRFSDHCEFHVPTEQYLNLIYVYLYIIICLFYAILFEFGILIEIFKFTV